MKTLKEILSCLLLAMMLILSNCAGTTYPAYHGNENYHESVAKWKVVNTCSKPLMVRIAEKPGMHYMELNPGHSHSTTTKRQDNITILVKTWEENGWSSEEIVAQIQRTARWGGIQVININDLLLHNVTLQEGIVVNSSPWRCKVWDNKGHQYGVLNVGQYNSAKMTPGAITVYYQPVGNHRVLKYRTYINQKKKDAEWNGRLLDWVISIE